MTDEERIIAELAAAAHEEPLFTFYERLLRAQQAHKATLALNESALAREGQSSALAREGIPYLEWARVAPEAGTFGAWLRAVAALWEEQDPGALEELDTLAPHTLPDLAETWFYTGSAGQGATVDALLANALAPRLERARDLLLHRLPLHLWEESYCPLCGGWPDFALWQAGAPTRLLCERCRTPWEVALPGCFYCGETDPQERGVYSTEDELYSVEVCDNCGQYLKGMNYDALPPGAAPLLEAERLLTPGLDLLAIQEGYDRPIALALADEEE